MTIDWLVTALPYIAFAISVFTALAIGFLKLQEHLYQRRLDRLERLRKSAPHDRRNRS